MHLPSRLKSKKLPALIAAILVVASCGGNNNRNTTAPSTDWVKGEYEASSFYGDFCQTPREGVHPYTNKAYPDRQGTTAHQNHFLRAWSHAKYLWYQELPDLDPNTYSDSGDYFALLKTSELTDNGNVKDRFHFSQDEVVGDQLTYTGEQGGYGISWKHVNGKLYVALVEQDTPASQAGVERGMWLSHVNALSLDNIPDEEKDNTNKAIYSPLLDSTAQFTFVTQLGEDFPASLTAQNVAVSAVFRRNIIASSTGDVGYLAFNTFNTYTAEDQLKEAFDFFDNSAIDDLVVDLRYNSGGYIYIGAQLGYLVAGNQADDNATFTVLQYNDKRNTQTKTYGFVKNTRNGQNSPQPLTSVNLKRVYVLTTSNTCSASEGFMNGLRGVGIEVIQIGGKTCGKPHGFNATSNCGRRYFSVDFETVNGQGFGDYADGFSPVASGGDPLTNQVNGCPASDDLTHALGNENEAMLQKALFYRENGQCPPEATSTNNTQSKSAQQTHFDGLFITPLANTVMREE